jgi:SAM-dependent methyltransferase
VVDVANFLTMENKSKNHWEKVYETKSPNEVSWTQEIPKTALDFIESFDLPKTASIIDIGGGDSNLVDHLLALGYENITVLDISEKAIERAQLRLGSNAEKVNWIVSDVTDFQPKMKYSVWHDRAAFHFLTQDFQKEKYIELVNQFADNYLIFGTFSENGPLKCSGLEIQQYSKQSLEDQFSQKFDLLTTKIEDHKTPFDTIQNFVFGVFKRK